MNRESIVPSRRAGRLGGAALILATLLFSAVFVYLAQAFDYPAVLDRPAQEVLPRLLALGPAGRAAWVLYGLIPLLLVPTGLGLHAATRTSTPLAARWALVLALLSAACMSIGLLRWPSLHWQLALAFQGAGPGTRETLVALVAASNSYLGQFIGEFLGELFLNGFFLAGSVALGAAGAPRGRWVCRAGVAASALGGVAMLRNSLPGIEPLAALNNAVLPLWMLVMGAAMWRLAPAPDAAAQYSVARCRAASAAS